MALGGGDLPGHRRPLRGDGDADHDEWLAFLGLIRKQRRRQPIDAALIQVGIDELLKMTDATRRDTAVELRQRLDELIRHLGTRFPSI